jgi:hypothetical protein
VDARELLLDHTMIETGPRFCNSGCHRYSPASASAPQARLGEAPRDRRAPAVSPRPAGGAARRGVAVGGSWYSPIVFVSGLVCLSSPALPIGRKDGATPGFRRMACQYRAEFSHSPAFGCCGQLGQKLRTTSLEENAASEIARRVAAGGHLAATRRTCPARL